MYEAFYGLRERPFNLTPDPKYLYLSEKHKEAFAHLIYGIKNRNGFVMITGEIGTGKTTLCRNLLNQLDSGTEVAFIFNPFLNPIELTRKINQEFGIKTQADTILGLTEELNVHLLNTAAHGKSCVLVIDEAQNLSPQVLEQIRLLSNIETDSEKLLQIILIGQPELGEKLQLHELRQLNQRITARYHLKPLNKLENLQYVAYRIHVAGGRKRINFTKGAIKQVYKLSGGVPRMINAICDRALLIGYTREERVITARLVRKALREIRGEKVVAATGSKGINWRRWLPAPSVAVLMVLVLALSHYLLDPVDRFARELRLFNNLLSGDMGESERVPTERHTSFIATEGVEAAGTGDSGQNRGALHLVMERLNAAGSSRPSESLAPLLAALAPESTLNAGIDALTALWNRELVDGYPEAHSAEALIAFFKQRGLDCEQLFLELEQLCVINLPCLARMRLGNTDFWMGVMRVDDRTVSLLIESNKRISVSHEEFNLYYSRELLAPWQDPAPESPILASGQRGSQVRALKEQLRHLGLIPPENVNDIYDRETEAAVRKLQQEAGLNADGKAGRQVRLALASRQGSTPALRRGPNQMALLNKPELPETGPDLSAQPSRKDVAAPREKALPIPPEKSDIRENTAFKAVEETSLKSEAVLIEAAPLLAATDAEPQAQTMPSSSEFEAKAPGAQGDNFLSWLQQQTSDDAKDTAEVNAGETNQTLMQVRELPGPGLQSALEEPKQPLSAVTEPVLGSVPLIPHGEVFLQ